MIAGTHQSKAALYDNYYSSYQYYYNLYLDTGFTQYYYDAAAFYYYYLAGYYSDYFGYYYDALGYKSRAFAGSNTYTSYYYELYTYDGDYLWHL
jgi:hypothetical protein